MMKPPISLYLVTGFLGSGKTTFLREVLSQITDRKVGVIVNEFGSIGIDGKVIQSGDLKLVEINNGSIFCSCLKTGFVKTLVAFLAQPIDVLFIEASGMADPVSMQSLLAQLPSFDRKKLSADRAYDYRGSICLVDCTTFLNFCELFTPTKNQVVKSNFILLNKTDLVNEAQLSVIEAKLSSLNPDAYLYRTQFGKLPLALLYEHLDPDEEGGETFNTPWNRPATYILSTAGDYDREKLAAFCTELAPLALRIKGFVTTDGAPVLLNAVGGAPRFEPMTNGIGVSKGLLRLVIIGKSPRDFKQTVQKVWYNLFDREPVFEEA